MSERSGATGERFRKKPVVIQAVQWWPSIERGHFEDDGKYVCRSVGCDALGVEYTVCDVGLRTMEGFMHIKPGYWIITGVKGERYACEPSIFELTYEMVPVAPSYPWHPTEADLARELAEVTEQRVKLARALTETLETSRSETAQIAAPQAQRAPDTSSEPGVAVSEAKFLRKLRDILAPLTGAMEPYTEEQANGLDAINERLAELTRSVPSAIERTPYERLRKLMTERIEHLKRVHPRDRDDELAGLVDLLADFEEREAKRG